MFKKAASTSVKSPESEKPEGHAFTKLFNKVTGQPQSYVKKSDYVFGKTLGAGSFGVVRQARCISTGENVAVKILLKKALKGNDVQLQMLYDELYILQQLNHPHIVKFKDWFESKDKFYIVTQLATGGELFDRILEKGKFCEADAAKIIKQLLEAVEYLHQKNIVHRDLKPENLLYLDKSEDSQLVVGDFGIAKELKDDNDLIHKAAGSMGYVAPEVLTSSGHGKPCDIWSIGVITYTLLCGYSPFLAESADGFIQECTSGPYPVVFHQPYWNSVSKTAKEFILWALTVNPKKRPSATELLNDVWITSSLAPTKDLLPEIRKGFNARRKFLNAVEIVKLNNRIKKLKALYGSQGEESDTDIEPNSTSSLNVSTHDSSFDSLRDSLKNLSVADDNKGINSKELKSALTQNAFAQLVLTATQNKEKVKNFRDSANED